MDNARYIEYLLAQLRFLNDRVQQLEKQVAEIREQKPIVVEKLEYRFDMLKVERLDGTLNIGVSPEAGKTIEELAVNNQTIDLSDEESERFREIRDRTWPLVEADASRLFAEYERQYRIVIGEEYRRWVLKEIRAQLDMRIIQYMQMHFQDGGVLVEEMNQRIVQLVARDCGSAIRQHLDALAMPKPEGGESP